MIELTLADGKELDIPEGSIVLFEEMTEDTNPKFPAARCFIKYQLGQEILSSLLSTKFEDVVFESKSSTDPRWLRLTLKDGRRLGILAQTIVARQGDDSGCRVTVAVSEALDVYDVSETRREIKKWTERALAPVAVLPTPSAES